jgi:hypothetical protein
MRHSVISFLLLTACSQRYAAPASIQTAAAPEETFDCVKHQLSSLGYKQSSIDVDEHRITGTKNDEKSRRSDVQFRRVINRMMVQVAPDAGGQTSVQAESHTFAEYTTQRGPTEVEEEASAEVKQDAQKLLAACRG